MGKSNHGAAAASPEDLGLSSGLTEAEVLATARRLMDQLRSLKESASTAKAITKVRIEGMEVVTRYLAGELPPKLSKVVEDLLREEPALRAVFAQVLVAWQTPHVEREVSPAEVDAAFARFKSRAMTLPFS